MSILINGMDMPKSCIGCWNCDFNKDVELWMCILELHIVEIDWKENRPSWCPLIETSTPQADVVEVVHGEWIKIDKRGKNVQCSKCGNTLDLRGVNAGRGDANYCPNCGARMGTKDGEIH